ncbi:MAG: flagellar hook-length control protein FliK [Mariprofundales bacterium]|nr:flagellar hook-length control protein FliK [Mariprofundales bacterium]
MKPGLTTATGAALPQIASASLRIVGGGTLPIAPGQRAEVTVHRASNGIFSITMQGKTVVVEGLPSTLKNGATIIITAKGDGGASSPQSQQLQWSLPRNSSMLSDAHTQTNAQKRETNHARRHAVTLALIKGGEALKSVPNGTKLQGKVVQLTAEHATLQLIDSNKAGASSPASALAYQSQRAFMLQTPRLTNMQLGDPIQATLGRTATGVPELRIVTEMAASTATSHTAPPKLQMQPGESALGWVRQRLDSGEVTITLRNTIVRSPAPPNIQPGDGVLLRMATPQRTSDQPTLELMRHLPQLSERLLTTLQGHLPNSEPIADSLTQIRRNLPAAKQVLGNTVGNAIAGPVQEKPTAQLEQWLARASHDQHISLTGERLAAIIRDAGQLFEHKLGASLPQPHTLSQQQRLAADLQQDLKAILTRLAATLESEPRQPPSASAKHGSPPPSPQPANIPTNIPTNMPPTFDQKIPLLLLHTTEAAQQGVSRIESGQLHNLLSSLHHEPIRLEFPMLVFNQLVTVQMAIGRPPEESEKRRATDHGARPYAILMALDLSHLGALRIDANISRQSVLARIHVENRASADFVQQHLPRVESRLVELDFSQVQILVSEQPPAPEKAKEFHHLKTMIPTHNRLLDTIV